MDPKASGTSVGTASVNVSGAVSGGATALRIETNALKHPSIISPVSPGPNEIDQKILEEEIRIFLEHSALNAKMQETRTPSPSEIVDANKTKANTMLRGTVTEYRKYAMVWMEKNKHTKSTEISGVMEGAIAAGKTTFAEILAKALCEMFRGWNVRPLCLVKSLIRLL